MQHSALWSAVLASQSPPSKLTWSKRWTCFFLLPNSLSLSLYGTKSGLEFPRLYYLLPSTSIKHLEFKFGDALCSSSDFVAHSVTHHFGTELHDRLTHSRLYRSIYRPAVCSNGLQQFDDTLMPEILHDAGLCCSPDVIRWPLNVDGRSERFLHKRFS